MMILQRAVLKVLYNTYTHVDCCILINSLQNILKDMK